MRSFFSVGWSMLWVGPVRRFGEGVLYDESERTMSAFVGMTGGRLFSLGAVLMTGVIVLRDSLGFGISGDLILTGFSRGRGRLIFGSMISLRVGWGLVGVFLWNCFLSQEARR